MTDKNCTCSPTGEDAEIAARTAEVEELAAWICNTVTPFCWTACGEDTRNRYRDYALDLINAGWRKAQA